MSVTDAEMIAEIQASLIEDSLFSSGLWTFEEVVGYFTLRQARFLKETQITAAWGVLGWTPGVPDHTLPVDWIATLSALWHDTDSGVYTPVAKSDSFELDNADLQNALTTGTPLGYRADDAQTLRIVLGPAPQAIGELEIIYVSLAEALTGLGIYFQVPDDFCPYLKYGVLATMLSKDGRGQDLLRARYCEQRYQEGVALASALLAGWAG